MHAAVDALDQYRIHLAAERRDVGHDLDAVLRPESSAAYLSTRVRLDSMSWLPPLYAATMRAPGM